MSEVFVTEFQPKHLDDILVRDELRKDTNILNGFLDNFDEGDPDTKIYSMAFEEKIVAVCGIQRLREGVAEIFIVTASAIKLAGPDFTETCRGLLGKHVAEWQLHRVEGYVREDFDIGIRWAETMGFEREGLLKKFGEDKSNSYLYARVF